MPSLDKNWLIGSGKEDKNVKSLQMDRLTVILTDRRTKSNTRLEMLSCYNSLSAFSPSLMTSFKQTSINCFPHNCSVICLLIGLLNVLSLNSFETHTIVPACIFTIFEIIYY